MSNSFLPSNPLNFPLSLAFTDSYPFKQSHSFSDSSNYRYSSNLEDSTSFISSAVFGIQGVRKVLARPRPSPPCQVPGFNIRDIGKALSSYYLLSYI
jgi:hypothetical protein